MSHASWKTNKFVFAYFIFTKTFFTHQNCFIPMIYIETIVNNTIRIFAQPSKSWLIQMNTQSDHQSIFNQKISMGIWWYILNIYIWLYIVYSLEIDKNISIETFINVDGIFCWSISSVKFVFCACFCSILIAINCAKWYTIHGGYPYILLCFFHFLSLLLVFHFFSLLLVFHFLSYSLIHRHTSYDSSSFPTLSSTIIHPTPLLSFLPRHHSIAHFSCKHPWLKHVYS